MPCVRSRPTTARLARLGAVLLGCLALAGCAGAAAVEAIYSVAAVETVPGVTGATSAQVLIPEPHALQALNTDKIAVKPTQNTFSYYQKVAWADTAPKLFQALLLQTFQNSGRVKAVGLPGESLLINYQVVTELRAFQVETFGSDRARIEVAVKLLNDSNGRVVDSEVFRAEVPTAGDSVERATVGLEAAGQVIATEILDWTLSRI